MTDASSTENVLVAWVPVLPIRPNLVNHLYKEHVSSFLNESGDRANPMVEEEQGIYTMGSGRRSADIHNQLQYYSPFGDHLGPP